MSYKLTIIQKPTYLQAVVTGLNSKKNVVAYLMEIHRECVARGYTKLLIEERLEGPRLNTFDVFDIASEGNARVFKQPITIAYVDVNASGHLMQFAETVARNRGILVTVFSTVAEAENWLMERSS
jgi:hypothetical protein